MRVYILTDLEGVAGVDQLDPHAYPIPGGRELREQMISLLLGEVNAAIEGALDAGATEVVILDGHGDGHNIPQEHLPREARLLRGSSGTGWLPCLDASIDAFLFLGQHAMEGTKDAVLPHSWSTRRRRRAFLNGVEIGEIGAAVALAASHGVPTVMLSGDRAAVEEVRRLVPGIEAVAVKEALGPDGAIHLSPEQARSHIRTAVEKGLRARARLPPRLWSPPFTFRLAFRERIMWGLPFLGARALGSTSTRALFGRIGRWAPGLGVDVKVVNLRAVEFSGDSLEAVMGSGLGHAAGLARHIGGLGDVPEQRRVEYPNEEWEADRS